MENVVYEGMIGQQERHFKLGPSTESQVSIAGWVSKVLTLRSSSAGIT